MMDYNAIAAEYAQHRKVHPGVLEGLLVGGNMGSVLEVGCGTGNYIGAVHRLTGARAFGIDPSAQMLATARERAPGVALTEGRAESLPYPDGQFDLVYSVDVIHHVKDRPAYIREAHRVLKPGGQVCTVTDSEWIIRQREPLTTYFPESVAHELARYPSIADLRRWMEQAGFTRISEQMVEHRGEITDIAPYRDKAFSSLHLISPTAFQAGLLRMEADLAWGPIPWVSRYVLLWGQTQSL